MLEVGTVALRNGVHVQVGRSSDVRDDLLARFRARGLQVLVLIAIAAVAGGFLLTRAGLAPLRALEGTVRSILETGQFDARVPVRRHSRDPLDELGARVNEMLERIEKLVGGMRATLDNVAHDLRTPLTRFRNVAEAALVAGDADAAREALVHALEEAGRVSATLRALMDISEAETGTMALVREPVRVGAVVEEAVALYADETEDKGIALRSTVPDDLRVIGDHTRLRQVFANLIENAVKYTERGGRIDIDARAADGFVTVTVSRHRDRHRARAPAACVGSAVPGRCEPCDSRPRPRPVPGEGGGRSPRRARPGVLRASAGQHIRREPAAGERCRFAALTRGALAPCTPFHICHLRDTVAQARMPSNENVSAALIAAPDI